jgi:hypothetical protein
MTLSISERKEILQTLREKTVESAGLLQEDSWVCSRLTLSSNQYCAECEEYIDFAILEIEIILTFSERNARENLTIF